MHGWPSPGVDLPFNLNPRYALTPCELLALRTNEAYVWRFPVQIMNEKCRIFSCTYVHLVICIRQICIHCASYLKNNYQHVPGTVFRCLKRCHYYAPTWWLLLSQNCTLFHAVSWLLFLRRYIIQWNNIFFSDGFQPLLAVFSLLKVLC